MTLHGSLELTLASWPDEDDLVAEITVDQTDVAKVVRRGDGLLMSIYSTGPHDFPMLDLLEVLAVIQRKLGPRPMNWEDAAREPTRG
jgi:hypothetical protein